MNAGMDGYSYEPTPSHGETLCPIHDGCVIAVTVTHEIRNRRLVQVTTTDHTFTGTSHGETLVEGPLSREQMGHGEYATMWADDFSLVVVECFCGWRTRSTKRLTAIERLNEHAGTPFSPELRSALARVS